jgi:hypothetical protein
VEFLLPGVGNRAYLRVRDQESGRWTANDAYVANAVTDKALRGDISNLTMLDGHTKTYQRLWLNLDVVNRFNPDWTVNGIGGKDLPD